MSEKLIKNLSILNEIKNNGELNKINESKEYIKSLIKQVPQKEFEQTINLDCDKESVTPDPTTILFCSGKELFKNITYLKAPKDVKFRLDKKKVPKNYLSV